MQPTAGIVRPAQFFLSALVYTTYNLAVRPMVSYVADVAYGIANSEPEYNFGVVTSTLQSYKSSVSFACNTTTDLLLPLADIYTSHNLAITTLPLVFNIDKLNSWLKNPLFIFGAPFMFRGINILIEQKDEYLPQMITNQEIVVRDSEFKGWYYAFNLVLETRMPNAKLLGFTTKLLAKYTIRFLDNVEFIVFKNQNIPLVDTKFFALPFIKNAMSTTCKFTADILSPTLSLQKVLDPACLFLGELTYNHAEGYTKGEHGVFDFSDAFNISSPQIQYLGVKSLWKNMHQIGEKQAANEKVLGKPLGYRITPFVAPRNSITKKLKRFFQTEDSSDYLDPDLMEITSIIGVEGKKIR